ncbi:MAG: efflux RND transporter permease subunit [Gammaproteobacteria bacterium]|nr:efflux RND transporter permease subunit [Gammaproteobacteria bacterium]MBP9729523.1 efflux RND transporter permease subunit [Gammaproteobacteria bacterium]
MKESRYFTDFFIRKPVAATVLSLLIVLFGLKSILMLSVREYPFIQNAVISVSTTYVGADPELMAGFISTPLENAIAQANGIDYIDSTSLQNFSVINATLRLDYDHNKALTEINTKVNGVLNQLPPEAQKPVIRISMGDTVDAMYIGFSSEVLPANKITDYLMRVIQPKLQAVEGVQTAEILGGRQFAMRLWLDPEKLSSYALTPTDIAQALSANALISAIGRIEGNMITINLSANTGLHSVDDYKNMIIRSQKGSVIRLSDVANISLGSDDYDSAVHFDGSEAVYIGIQVAPGANFLTVVQKVRTLFDTLQRQLPVGLDGKIVYDATKFVNSSIQEVVHALIAALLIVTGMVFLFLANIRSVIIPVIAIPLSLIGTFFIMFLLGYSINLLTLLALVLAIGLVVDDAIIVVENIQRHRESGLSPKDAALRGARELANPIMAISIVLMAVYAPIGFMGGLTGTLFSEFAFTLAGSVGISAITALTLSPMMCAGFIRATEKNTFSLWVDKQFERLRQGYVQKLNTSLDTPKVAVVFLVIVLGAIVFLYKTAHTELAPQEDHGIVLSVLKSQPNASLQQTQIYSRQANKIFSGFPALDHVFQFDGAQGLNTSIAGMVLKPWNERSQSAQAIQDELQKKLAMVAGAHTAVFQPASLPGGGGGLPVQLVITTTEPYEALDKVVQTIYKKAMESGSFVYLDTNLNIDKLQIGIDFDREKIADVGLNIKDISDALAFGLGGNYINQFSLAGRAYKVIPQIQRKDRLNAYQLMDYYVNTAEGLPIALSNIASIKKSVVPEELHRFQQLNAATISGVPFPGLTLGKALSTLESIAEQNLPREYSFDYAGQSRQYKQENNALFMTFLFSGLVIFLCLSALFESFRDPWVILSSVPLSIVGAMLFINLGFGGMSLNIYTTVGLVTLMGLISKHGILIVQFANQLQKEGKSKREAVELAASIRLRPILMTSVAMVLGVVPLMTASGAGALSRFNIGLVIASGISIGTALTLFVLPSIYLLLAKTHTKTSSALQ